MAGPEGRARQAVIAMRSPIARTVVSHGVALRERVGNYTMARPGSPGVSAPGRRATWPAEVALDLGRDQHPARAEAGEHGRQVDGADGEASFAAAEHAMRAQHLGPDVPGRVDDDRPRLGVAVGGLQAEQAHRGPVGADVIVAGQIGAFRGGLRAGVVGEPAQPAGMLGIRSAAVGDQQALDAAALHVDQMQARQA